MIKNMPPKYIITVEEIKESRTASPMEKMMGRIPVSVVTLLRLETSKDLVAKIAALAEEPSKELE